MQDTEAIEMIQNAVAVAAESGQKTIPVEKLLSYLAALNAKGTGVQYPAERIIEGVAVSRSDPVNARQASAFAAAIECLDSAILKHFEVSERRNIPLNEGGRIFSLPEYGLLVKTAHACGFLMPADSIHFDYSEIHQDPEGHIGRLSFPRLRCYFHRVIRDDHGSWNYSKVLEAFQCGAFPLAAKRLVEDSTLYASSD